MSDKNQQEYPHRQPRVSGSRVYVGNLHPDLEREKLVRMFESIGEVTDVQLKKTVSNDWFSFVHFADPETARLAVERFDGKEFFGRSLRVELPLDGRRHVDSYRRTSRPPYMDSGRRFDRDGPYRGGSSYMQQRPSRTRVLIRGLPASGSWQDVKDHFREFGESLYADVTPSGSGIVVFECTHAARRAVERLNNSEFISHEGERSIISLSIAEPSNDFGYSRAPRTSYRDRGPGGGYPSYRSDRIDNRRRPTRSFGGYRGRSGSPTPGGRYEVEPRYRRSGGPDSYSNYGHPGSRGPPHEGRNSGGSRHGSNNDDYPPYNTHPDLESSTAPPSVNSIDGRHDGYRTNNGHVQDSNRSGVSDQSGRPPWDDQNVSNPPLVSN